MEAKYIDRVYKLLLEMELGRVIIIADFVAPKNRELFITSVKRYINDHHYHPDHQIEFDNGYRAIEKVYQQYYPVEPIPINT